MLQQALILPKPEGILNFSPHLLPVILPLSDTNLVYKIGEGCPSKARFRRALCVQLTSLAVRRFSNYAQWTRILPALDAVIRVLRV